LNRRNPAILVAVADDAGLHIEAQVVARDNDAEVRHESREPEAVDDLGPRQADREIDGRR